MPSIAARVPPVTARSPLAVKFAPEPMVKIPLLEVTSPVTLPAPFQLPPVTPKVPPREPLVRLMIPPLRVAAPLADPLAPVSVPLPIARVPVKAPFKAKAAPEAKVTPLVEATVPLRVLPVLLKVVTPVSVKPVPPFTVPLVTPVVPETEPIPERVVPEATVMLPVKAESRAKVPKFTLMPPLVVMALLILTVPVLPVEPMRMALLLVAQVPVLNSTVPSGAACNVAV